MKKYSNHYCKFMGTYTFENAEVNMEVIKDFKGWKRQRYEGQTIFYKED